MKLIGTIKQLVMENVKTPKLVFGDQLPAFIPPSLLRELMDELDAIPEPHKIMFEKDEHNIIRKFKVIKDDEKNKKTLKKESEDVP